MDSANLNSDYMAPARFCALEYKSSDRNRLGPAEPLIIAVLIMPAEDGLLLLVHPNWKQLIASEDDSYLQALFDDLKERAIVDPDGVFKQVSFLSVGPLITHATGTVARADLLERWKGFCEF